MIRRWLPLAGLLAGCSALPTQGNGVVALQLDLPTASIVLFEGDSITLHARALNLQGDSVAADIVWATTDTLLISLDDSTGKVIALSDSGVARIQASVGTLRSDLIPITLSMDTTTAGSLTSR
ncbi:MAG: hypothetical protein ACREL5_03215 [Gemmatimonadales bacterium]